MRAAAIRVMEVLRSEGVCIEYHDPFVPEFNEEGHRAVSVPLTRESLAKCDCVMIVTDHSNIDYDLIRREAKVVVDTRNALKRG